MGKKGLGHAHRLTDVKVANKRAGKQRKKEKYKKAGKKKKEKQKELAAQKQSQSQQTLRLQNNDEDVVSDADVQDMIEKKDLRFLNKSARNYAFLNLQSQGKMAIDSDNPNAMRNGNARRKKLRDDEDEEVEFEEISRKRFKDAPAKQLKPLLPIKGKEGVIERFEEVSDDDLLEFEETDDETIKENQPAEPIQPLTPRQLFIKRNKKLMIRKERIALLATRIVEEPEKNIKSLKELRLMLDEKDRDISITVRKLAAASLLEVFKDILPEYRIRAVTDKEKEQRMKKETKELQIFEQGVLRHYKIYLQRLELMLKGLKTKDVKKDSIYSLGDLSIKCLCELLLKNPLFNYRNNIISLLVPFMDSKAEEISDHVCDCMKRLFREDKLGEASLEVVKHVARLLKEKQYNVQPKVLRTFLSLKIQSITEEKENKKFMTKKEKMKKLSRNERKRSKQMEELERELEATQAEESKQTKTKFQTEIISQIFVIYFRILKKAITSILLPAVLEGLSKFAHLINIDFFDDLVTAFHQCIDSGVLSYKDSLHCVQTVFAILSGQGEALNVDPLRFYTHLYKNLIDIHAGSPSDDILLLIKCLDMAFLKRRKQVTIQRVLAFIKRLSTNAAHLDEKGALSVLVVIKLLLQNHRNADILLDTDASLGSGLYLPELEEPEYCNASSTALWELHLLQRHHDPIIHHMSTYILQGCPLQKPPVLASLLMKSPAEIWENFSTKEITLPPCSVARNKRLKCKTWPYFMSKSLEKHASTAIHSEADAELLDFSEMLNVNKNV